MHYSFSNNEESTRILLIVRVSKFTTNHTSIITTMRLLIILTGLLLEVATASNLVKLSSDFLCTICGSGAEIGNYDGFVTTSHGQTATCGALKDHVASLDLDACRDLQSIANGPCECQEVGLTTNNDRIPQFDTTPRSGYDSFECSICGNGEMGNPNGYALGATGQPIKCQELHDTRGSITSQSTCDRVQSLASIPCNCRGESEVALTSSTLGYLFPGEASTPTIDNFFGDERGAINSNSNSDSSLCSICGNGLIRNPGGIVTNDRGQQKTCAELEANRSNIPENTCSSLQASALEPCACDFDLSYANDSNEEYIIDESFSCSICGNGKKMTNLMAVVKINDDQPEVLCGALNVNAHKISMDTCTSIQATASETCGCISSSETHLEEIDSSLENTTEEELIKCFVCGDGELTIPQGIVTTRQGKSARCDVLNENPKNVSHKACTNIQGLSRYPCGCLYPELDLNVLDEIVPFQCSICNGGEVTILDGVVATPEGQAVRCDVLEINANTIPQDACPQIQMIASEPCGCTTPVVVHTKDSADGQELVGPDVDESLICHVCGGPAQEIGFPGKMVITSAGMFTCHSVYSAGLVGAIAIDQCSNVQTAVQKECGCFVDVPTASPSDSPFICSVCGNGKVITRPDGIIDGTNNTTCFQYEAVAAKGEISEDQCSVLQQVSDVACGCEEPQPEPTASPTSYECKICGEGRMIGLPDSELVLPNLQKMTCWDVQQRAEAGIIQDFQCNQIQPLAFEHCGCIDEPRTEAPDIFHCQLCGDGFIVKNPNGIVKIPTQPDRTCAELAEAAVIGHINPNQCFLLGPFVQAPCECVSTFTKFPASSPEYADISMREDCFSDLRDIQAMERSVKDTSITRKYILCPGKTFHMGSWTEEGDIKDGQPFLALRPNVVYQCGLNGSRMDNCVLKGGDFGVASYDEVIEGIVETVPGVEIRGLTFESQNLFSVLLKSAGDVTFIGCAFKVSESIPYIRVHNSNNKIRVHNSNNKRSLTTINV